MKIILRIIAVLIATSVLTTAYIFSYYVRLEGMGHLIGLGLPGIMTLIGWILTLSIGPFAVYHLWRLNKAGLILGLIFSGYSILYYVSGILISENISSPTPQIIINLTFNASTFLILLTPQAKKLCTKAEAEAKAKT